MQKWAKVSAQDSFLDFFKFQNTNAKGVAYKLSGSAATTTGTVTHMLYPSSM